MAEIIVNFTHKGDAEVLDAIKKVTKNINDLKRMSKIDLDFVKKSVNPADFSRIKTEVEAARKATSGLASGFNHAGQQAQGLGTSLGFVGRILAAMAIRQVAREVFQMADAFTAFQNKLKTVVQEDSVGFISKEIFNIAQESRTSLESIATAFSRTTRSVKALGKSQQEVLQFTGTLSKAIQLGGSTAVEASNAMIQLAQGMGSGALRGDELRSVLEQLPIVAELIADKMGVPMSALRKLGSEGLITTEVIFDAINNRTAEIDEKMKNMQLTVGQAWTRLVNQMTMESARLGGVMKALANTIQFVTDHMDFFINVFLGLSSALAAGFMVKGINALIAGFRMLGAAVALGTGGLSLIIPVLAVVTAGLLPFIANINTSSDSTVTFGDVWTAAWEEAKDTFKGDELKNGLDDTRERIDGLSDSTIKWIMRMGEGLDLLAKFSGVQTTMFSDKAKKFTDRVDMNAVIRTNDKLMDEGKNIMAEDMANDRGPNTQGAAKAKTKREGGKTWEEVLKQATFSEEVSKQDDIEEKIRTRIHKAFESLKPSIKANGDEMRKQIVGIQKEWEIAMLNRADVYAMDPSIMADDKKAVDAQIAGLQKRANLADANKAKLEELVRMEITREEIQKQRLKDEEEAEKLLEKNIKLLEDEEEAARKVRLERQKTLVAEQSRKFDRDVAISNALDPNIQNKIKLQELREFEKTYAHIPELAFKARNAIDELEASMATGGATLTYMSQFESIWGQGGTMSRGFSDIAAKVITFNLSLRETKDLLRDLLTTLEQQALSSLFQLGIDSAIGALGNSIGGTSGNGITSGGLMGPGGKPTNIEVTGTVGNQINGKGLYGEGFAEGGYTGNFGVNQVAGLVHGQEFVMNADATKSYRPMLEAMNKGASPVPAPTQAKVTVHNYAGVQVETGVTGGEVQIMISKALREQTPGVVAQSINNPNSQVSRALNKNLQTDRRRT